MQTLQFLLLILNFLTSTKSLESLPETLLKSLPETQESLPEETFIFTPKDGFNHGIFKRQNPTTLLNQLQTLKGWTDVKSPLSDHHNQRIVAFGTSDLFAISPNLNASIIPPSISIN